MGLGATGYIFLKLGLSITDEDVKNSSARPVPGAKETCMLQGQLTFNACQQPFLMGCTCLLQSSQTPTSTSRAVPGRTGGGEHPKG